jgi:bifunctional non-homologous end joining protein LigD
VKTKRSLKKIEAEGEAYKKGKMYAPGDVKAAAKRKGAAKTSPEKKPDRKSRLRVAPQFVSPQLAKLADAPPEGDGWLHEIKFDGYRIIAVVKDGKARLLTRNAKDWTHKYGRVAKAVEAIGLKDAVFDGELVALDESGAAAFSKMQAAAEDPAIPLQYYLFDLLNAEGEDTRELPLLERKERLKDILASPPDGIGYSDHIRLEGDQVLASACSMKLEGRDLQTGGCAVRIRAWWRVDQVQVHRE